MRGKNIKLIGAVLLCLGFLGFVCTAMAAPVELINVTNTQWKYDQSGVDQGQIWRGAGFSDDAWPSGVGLFAGGETTSYGVPFNTALTRTAPDTVYLRARFNWVGENTGLILAGTLYIDDGVVIYVNGREAYRFNISTTTWPVDQAGFGNAGSGTYAVSANPGGEPVIEEITFPGTNVFDGENIIAVQVHQNSDTSSDVVFGLQLYGDVAQAPAITTQPVGTNVLQGRPFTLTVAATGLPAPTYQWYQNGLPITGATSASYTVATADPDPTTGDGGPYYVIVSNSAGQVQSSTVNVTVTPDTAGPNFVRGVVLADGTLELLWDEDMSGTFDSFGAFVYDSANPPDPFTLEGAFRLTSAAPTGPSQLCTLSDAVGNPTNLTPGINYSIWIGTPVPGDPPFGFSDIFTNYCSIAEPNIFTESLGQGFIRTLATSITIAGYSSQWAYDSSGLDLLTSDPPFYALTFDDGQWPKGPAPLGTEDAGTMPDGLVIATSVPTTPTTTFYRLRFFLPGSPDDIQSMRLARVLYDDGFVAYLNGQEVARSGVAANQTIATFGTSHEADAYSGQAFNLPVTNLIDGENLLAVELHNTSATSSDNVWACDIVGVVGTVVLTAPEITSQTTGPIALAERDALTLSVTATGTQPLRFQWMTNGVDIPDATNSTYAVGSVTATNAGSYTVEVSNVAGSVTSAAIAVTVTADTVRPTLVSGLAEASMTSIVLEFSEPISRETATNTANYTVALRAGGGDLTIIEADYLGSSRSNIVLTTSARQTDNYRVTVRDLTDRSVALNLINPNPSSVDIATEVYLADIADIGDWYYNDTVEGAAPANWNQLGFDPAAAGWKLGEPLFYGKRGTPGNLDLALGSTLNLSNAAVTAQLTSFYFRVNIDLSAADVAATPLKFQYILDDGAVFYVNGTEVLRTGMPDAPAPIFSQTLADRTQGNDQLWEDPIEFLATPVVAGQNVVAVEVHQVSATSSDVAFALRVLGTQGTVTPQLRITDISLDGANNVIITHNGASVPGDEFIQQATSLAANPAATVWTDRPGGPHASPHNAGAATGSRFFRLRGQ